MKKTFLFSLVLLACIVGCEQSQPTVDLSTNGTANCYIVSAPGTYSIPAVKGNSNESVGNVKSVEVLWESCGSDDVLVKDLIQAVEFKTQKICFKTANVFKRGNALIAAKDNKGNILWSWHIWMTEQPQEQVYYNDAGVMMDRDLGAILNSSGDMCDGMLYQWGRKDPFAKYSLKSTIDFDWEMYDAEIGTVEYATVHPTTEIGVAISEYEVANNGSWCYHKNRKLWDEDKTIYDPCPVGWRVPDRDIWKNAMGLGIPHVEFHEKGYLFAQNLGEYNVIYPQSHYWTTALHFFECFDRIAGGDHTCEDYGSYKAYVRCQKIE